MAQTYAVVYDQSKNFFIAIKNTVSFFYHSTTGGQIFPPNGTPITHGPGEAALPGGGLTSTDPAIGAANEFQEETGVELRSFDGKLTPKEWHDGKDKTEYYGVYFQFSNTVFNQISSTAIANLKTGVDAAADIKNKKITSYQDIFKKYPHCPQDNELARGEVWNLDRDWSKIQALNNSQNTNWFYVILKNLKDQIN
jgi:8-oxo-dGTP pyrophosphatase MutT (NUDIX family)